MLFIGGPLDGEVKDCKGVYNAVEILDGGHEASSKTTRYVSRSICVGQTGYAVVMCPEKIKDHEIMARIVAVYFHKSLEVLVPE